LDLDSDGDLCPDLVEAGVVNRPGATFTTGSLVNTSGTVTRGYARINGPFGNNGFAASIENNDLLTASYTGTYTYANAINIAINSACNALKPNGNIVGGNICIGQDGKLTFNATAGTGPYRLVINGVTYNGIISGTSFNVIPKPTATKIYNLSSITDSNNYSQP
jgi:hypothetical protein